MPTKLILKLIDLYQRTLSRDKGLLKDNYTGGHCKYTPHCSEYGRQAIKKHGLIAGGAYAIYRILRCNPWSKGGWDPVR